MDPRISPQFPLDGPEISPVVSSTECTGLMPANPTSQAELDAELELFSTSLPPKDPQK